MGQAISSATHMINWAGDLRRDAKRIAEPEHAQKLARAAAQLETAAIAKLGKSDSNIGALLDTFA